eukprot:5519128-Amphidinium_carterae.1
MEGEGAHIRDAFPRRDCLSTFVVHTCRGVLAAMLREDAENAAADSKSEMELIVDLAWGVPVPRAASLGDAGWHLRQCCAPVARDHGHPQMHAAAGGGGGLQQTVRAGGGGALLAPKIIIKDGFSFRPGQSSFRQKNQKCQTTDDGMSICPEKGLHIAR